MKMSCINSLQDTSFTHHVSILQANAVDRIIMGGEERTVSVTGWALGGGHSPVSRKLGLGVDNIVEMEMVTADLSVVVMNDNGITTTLDNGTVCFLFFARAGR